MHVCKGSVVSCPAYSDLREQEAAASSDWPTEMNHLPLYCESQTMTKHRLKKISAYEVI